MSNDVSVSHIIFCNYKVEESLSSAQYELSCSLQSFFSEALSCSTLLALASGQGLAALVQCQGYRFLSPLLKPKVAKLIATSLSYAFEGICFNSVSTSFNLGQFQIGSLNENLHGISTITVCKAMSSRSHSFLTQNLLQNSALITLDLFFETCGMKENNNANFTERFLSSELSCFRMEFSSRILAAGCPSIGFLQARYKLDYEMQSSEKINKKNVWTDRWIDPIQQLFSPTLVTSTGEKIKEKTFYESKSNQTQPFMTAKDFALMMASKNPPQSKKTKPIFIPIEDPLERLPPTVQERLKLVKEGNREVAQTLEKIWCLIYETKELICGPVSRGDLVSAYQRAVDLYCSKQPQIKFEGREALKDFGFSIFFAKVPENENYHTPYPIYGMHLAQANRGRGKVKATKPKIMNDFSKLATKNPSLAKLVKWSLAAWRANRPNKGLIPDLKSENIIHEIELMARDFLRSLPDKIDIHYFYAEVLPSVVEFIPCSAEILGEMDLTPFKKVKKTQLQKPPQDPDSQLRLKKDEQITNQEAESLKSEQPFPGLTDKLVPAPLDLSPLSQRPLIQEKDSLPKKTHKIVGASTLRKAMAKSKKTQRALIRLSEVRLDLLLTNLEKDPSLRTMIEPETIAKVKRMFDQLKVHFETSDLYEELYPIIGRIFSRKSSTSPEITITRRQFKKASHYNLGAKILAYRLDSQHAEERITLEDIAEIIEKSAGAVQRYEINALHISEDHTLIKIIENLLKLDQEEREIAYIASRPHFVELYRVKVEEEDGSLVSLTKEEIEEFQKRRKYYLNKALLKEEFFSTLAKKGMIDKKNVIPYLISQGIEAVKAKKLISLSDPYPDEEIRDITEKLGLSYANWRRHYDLPADTYFLGIDEEGNIRYPSQEDFWKIDHLPESPPELIERSLPKSMPWEQLTTEQQWYIHLHQRLLNEFGSAKAAAKKIGISAIDHLTDFSVNIIKRVWTNETLAQFSYECDLSFEERRLLYIYFRRVSLEEKLKL